MKVATARIAATLAQPPAAILLYGEDGGLVQERSRRLIASAAGAKPSPFQMTTLLREEHARLTDEATLLPLNGTRRIVRVQDAGDGLVGALKKLEQGRHAFLIILEAGGLTPRSKLRMFMEASQGWAALPCYPETERELRPGIQRVIRDAGRDISAEAVEYLVHELAGDSGSRRQELDKLLLFTHGQSQISVEDAVACCSMREEPGQNELYAAALSGRVTETDLLLGEATAGSGTGAGLLAGFSIQVHRLLRLALALESGLSSADALRGMRPPVYPRQADTLLRQARLWSRADLMRLLGAITVADTACKRAASRDDAIASRLILDTARHAARGL